MGGNLGVPEDNQVVQGGCSTKDDGGVRVLVAKHSTHPGKRDVEGGPGLPIPASFHHL